ncbi:MAG: YgiQ family radical SAM protein [Oscillospiraceae bacterium]|nr:YgiQ family radical SAM protein [Oscillospiraceae bacterium]
MGNDFLPICKADMEKRGWDFYDFLYITGDAYVDHPSFGVAVISRVLEAAGYRVAILSQPDWKDVEAFRALGKPRLGILVTGGNIDSMVAHYTVAKHRRRRDDYTPGGVMGKRPDRAMTTYCRMARRAYPDLPIAAGGLEASLRRFAHYDYWDDTVRRSELIESGADLLMFGMGEDTIVQLADALNEGVAIADIKNIRGTVYKSATMDDCIYPFVTVPSYDEVKKDKRKYAIASKTEQDEQDAVRGRAVVQKHGDVFVVQTPPQYPISTARFDEVYELPYMRDYHPSYEKLGGVKAIEEVKFSIIHNRGCFGGCNFCSLAFHQGRMISTRSHDSVVDEAKKLTQMSDFKGYIHDVGGPTANFRAPSCPEQKERGMCKKNCLAPRPCKNLRVDHNDYIELLRKLRELPKVKRVFIRSGVRFDYVMADKNDEFFHELVKYHVSGQLKVAPEHSCDSVLKYMNKPHFDVYRRFYKKFFELDEKYNKNQFLVPYLISSHPGCTLRDAVGLAEYLNSIGHMPEQVQDFYPTPGTIATCMYYTGLDPNTMESVYVPRDPSEKAMQRALLQWRRPECRALVKEALKKAGREDLIGNAKRCLIHPDKPSGARRKAPDASRPFERGSDRRKGRGRR